MQNFDVTTGIKDVNHLCMSNSVEEAARMAYELASSMMVNVVELCKALPKEDETFREPVHNISLKTQMIVNTLSKYVNND